LHAEIGMDSHAIDFSVTGEHGRTRIFTVQLLVGDLAEWVGRPEAEDPAWRLLPLAGDLVLGVRLAVGPAIPE
jgi:hypothetical protein